MLRRLIRVKLLSLVSCFSVIGGVALSLGCYTDTNLYANAGDEMVSEDSQVATFGGGCFWCVEAVFQQLKGIEKVVSGYAGGHVEDPSYKQVVTGTTGHAEVCQIHYDPNIISYEELLEVFWKSHDPTTLNRQGADVGPQYRSIILYHNEEQKALAEEYKKKLNEANVFGKPIVTEIEEFEAFYPAEDYHQEYFQNNPRARYCQFVIAPKVEKIREVFKDKLKKD